ncbi:hypothetical protein VTN49DRAFT_6528 [Thermomyces lanuginosus]|uniref:uncharacterized protein n=1 Tax=Thermomyces lanuginosus TaxID=5541 RepID=UPI003742F045
MSMPSSSFQGDVGLLMESAIDVISGRLRHGLAPESGGVQGHEKLSCNRDNCRYWNNQLPHLTRMNRRNQMQTPNFIGYYRPVATEEKARGVI